MWGQGQPEQRLKRLEGLLGQLLGNPSIDNARRGPLQIPNADVLPGNERNTRLQLSNPTLAQMAGAGTTHFYMYDTTFNWPHVEITLGNIAAAAGAITLLFGASTAGGVVGASELRVQTQSLPDIRLQVARPNVGTSTVLAGLQRGDNQGVYFRATSGNWFAVTNNGSETATDTGVAVSTAKPQLLRIRFTGPSIVEFSIDGTLVRRETATIPTVDCGVGYVIRRTTGAPQLRGSRWISLSEDIGGQG